MIAITPPRLKSRSDSGSFREQQLSEEDEMREMDRTWKEEMKKRTLPGYEKLKNIKYKGD